MQHQNGQIYSWITDTKIHDLIYKICLNFQHTFDPLVKQNDGQYFDIVNDNADEDDVSEDDDSGDDISSDESDDDSDTETDSESEYEFEDFEVDIIENPVVI